LLRDDGCRREERRDGRYLEEREPARAKRNRDEQRRVPKTRSAAGAGQREPEGET
jgi:hypothetical protein